MARILVVDDDKFSRDTVGFMLTDEGHTVEVATDGRKAIVMQRDNPFDLIVTDLIMPGKEGIEMILELLKREPSLKIIAMSSGDRQNLEVAKTLGATQILAKPFSCQQLADMVQRVLASPSQQGPG